MTRFARLTIVVLLATSTFRTARAADIFVQENWFQITFCERIAMFDFLPGATASQLPIQGISSDPFNNTPIFHYYHWNVLNGSQPIHRTFEPAEGTHRLSINGATLSHDHQRVLLGSDSHDLILYDMANQVVTKRLTGHRSETYAVAMNQTETLFAATDSAHTLWIWRGDDLEQPVTRVEITANPLEMEFINIDTEIRVLSTDYIQRFNVETGALLNTVELRPKLHNPSFNMNPIIWNGDRSGFYAADTNDDLGFYLLSDGKAKWTVDFGNIEVPPGWPSMTDTPQAIALSPNGKCVATSNHKGFKILSPLDGQIMFEQRLMGSSNNIKFSPDGKYLVSADGCSIATYATPPSCL